MAKTFLQVACTPQMHLAVVEAAKRKRKSISAYAREAINQALLADESYFYVKLPDGTFWPPVEEPGFEDLGVARLSAAKRGGEVVSKRYVK